jgi:uncharacterized RDD family membrane protein YckC
MELSERVENFRRRRAHLRKGDETDENLGFDFTRGDDLEDSTEVGAKVLEFPRTDSNLEVELGYPPAGKGELPVVEATPLEKPGGGLRILSSAAVQAGEVVLEQDAQESEPVEILVSPPEPAADPDSLDVGPLDSPLAPLGNRFLAGLADALVLFLGAGLFALIFLRAGGRLSLTPLNLAVVAFIAAFLIFFYFGLFTALSFSTPGLLWMGIEVRNMDGTPPTAGESLLRAFGYLVSISALMLGFIWAAVDNESLTWHDRMSGTCLVPVHRRKATESPKSKN